MFALKLLGEHLDGHHSLFVWIIERCSSGVSEKIVSGTDFDFIFDIDSHGRFSRNNVEYADCQPS
jgi:hypothetical protein